MGNNLKHRIFHVLNRKPFYDQIFGVTKVLLDRPATGFGHAFRFASLETPLVITGVST